MRWIQIKSAKIFRYTIIEYESNHIKHRGPDEYNIQYDFSFNSIPESIAPYIHGSRLQSLCDLLV